MSNDMWVTASQDVETEALERHITSARISASRYWPLVAEATSQVDFDNRMALIEDRLATVASAEAGGDPVLFGVVHTALKTGFAEDFAVVDADRRREAMAARVAAARKVAADKDFEQIGYEAYGKPGVSKAPVLNQEVHDALAGLPVGSQEGADIMRAYTRGWDRAADEAASYVIRDSASKAAARKVVAYTTPQQDYDRGLADGQAAAAAGLPSAVDLTTLTMGLEGPDYYTQGYAAAYSAMVANRPTAARHTANQYVRKSGNGWVVVNKSGDVISHHDSQEKAQASFEAMEAGKHSGGRHVKADADTGISGVDLTGKDVIVSASSHVPEYRDPTWLVFHCEGGFGADPDAIGTKVMGTYVRDGEQAYVRRPNIERLATPEEVAAAKAAGSTTAARKEAAREDFDGDESAIYTYNGPSEFYSGLTPGAQVRVIDWSYGEGNVTVTLADRPGAGITVNKSNLTRVSARKVADGNPFAKKDDDAKSDAPKDDADKKPNPFAKKDDDATPADDDNPDGDTKSDVASAMTLFDGKYEAQTLDGKTLEEAIAAGEPIQYVPVQQAAPADPTDDQQTAPDASQDASAGSHEDPAKKATSAARSRLPFGRRVTSAVSTRREGVGQDGNQGYYLYTDVPVWGTMLGAWDTMTGRVSTYHPGASFWSNEHDLGNAMGYHTIGYTDDPDEAESMILADHAPSTTASRKHAAADWDDEGNGSWTLSAGSKSAEVEGDDAGGYTWRIVTDDGVLEEGAENSLAAAQNEAEKSLGQYSAARTAANPYTPVANPYVNDPPTGPGTPDADLDGPPPTTLTNPVTPTTTRPAQQPSSTTPAAATDTTPDPTKPTPTPPAPASATASRSAMYPIVCRKCGSKTRVASVRPDLSCPVCKTGANLDLDEDLATTALYNDPDGPAGRVETYPSEDLPMDRVEPDERRKVTVPDGSAPYSVKALGSRKQAESSPNYLKGYGDGVSIGLGLPTATFDASLAQDPDYLRGIADGQAYAGDHQAGVTGSRKQASWVSLVNPDDPMGMPLYEGDSAAVAAVLTDGAYDGTDADGNPVTVVVSNGFSALGARRRASRKRADQDKTEWFVTRSAPETRRGFEDVAGPFDSQEEAEAAKPEGPGYSVYPKRSVQDQVSYERFMTSSRTSASHTDSSKVAEIVAAVLKTNPGMSRAAALDVARKTIARYPAVARR